MKIGLKGDNICIFIFQSSLLNWVFTP